MRVLVVDVGGNHVKILASGEAQPRRMDSGPTLTAAAMVEGVKQLAAGWRYDVVTVGFPGPVVNNTAAAEPCNLGKGWAGFDFAAAFGCPVRVINDAAMQALGSYQGGTLLFLGLGTGLGTTIIKDGVVVPLEIGHLPYGKATFEDYVGARGLEKRGKKKWRRRVAEVVAKLVTATRPDDVVLGGGNIQFLDALPEGCRAGDNANAFLGGFSLWPADKKKVRATAATTKRSR